MKKGSLITCLIIYIDDNDQNKNIYRENQTVEKEIVYGIRYRGLERGLKYFLRIEILRSSEEIFIYQRKYVVNLLAETRMLDCKVADTPIHVNHKLQIVEGAT